MFFTYLNRELRRRRRSAFVVAAGLALGIGLVITVSAASKGVSQAQGQVLSSLYGVGTDITVTQAVERGAGAPNPDSSQGPGRFDFGSGDTTSTSVTQDRLTVGRGTTAIDATDIDTIAAQPHVAAAIGSLSLTDTSVSGSFTAPTASADATDGSGTGGSGTGGGFPGGGGNRGSFDVASFTVEGVDVSTGDIGPLATASLTDGRWFTTDDATSPVALVGADYANDKALATGGTVSIAGTDVTIVGLVSGGSSDIYLPLGEAQTLAGETNMVTTIYVKATSTDDVAAAQSEIEAALPGTTVQTSADLASQISGSLASASSLAKNLGTWLSVAVLLAAFVLAALFTISSVTRRVREFGTLKALGWKGRRIVGQILGESLAQGIIGGAVGIGLGFLGAALVAKLAPPLSATISAANSFGTGAAAGGFGGRGGFGGSGASAAADAGAAAGGGAATGTGNAFRSAAEAVTVHLSAPVTLATIGLAVLLAVAGGVIAGGIGGWRASRLRPADALRRFE